MSPVTSSSGSSSSSTTSVVYVYSTMPSVLDDLPSTDEVIDDCDLRVIYGGSWVQDLADPNVPSHTTHTTIVKDSDLSLNFTGTGIQVLGTATTGSDVLQAVYTIDGDHADQVTRSISGTGIQLVSQTFYSITGLPLGNHILQVRVGLGADAQLPRQFVIDSFVVIGASGSTPGSTSGSASAASPTVAILGADLTTTTKPSSTSQSLTTSSTSTKQVNSGTTPQDIPAETSLTSPSLSGTPADPTPPSSADANLPASNSSHVSAGKIAGAVVGSVLGLVLLICLVLTVFRWISIYKRRNPKPDIAPRPLIVEQEQTCFVDLQDGKKKTSGFVLSPPPKIGFKQTTSPGPPSEPSDRFSSWTDTFGPDVQKIYKKS